MSVFDEEDLLFLFLSESGNVCELYILLWVDVVCTLKFGRRVLKNVMGVVGLVNFIGMLCDGLIICYE